MIQKTKLNTKQGSGRFVRILRVSNEGRIEVIIGHSNPWWLNPSELVELNIFDRIKLWFMLNILKKTI